ncbi:phosphopantetheine-binding protein [Dyella ginsengisoli]|uniref:phosphopantetheine-binding protein n=1 Tax=Dyella ginsengisoli TaxID=363848 RepID=UPI001F528B42|nr:phosphopantetheine-binding protein [Dyella ginsengisoli]
MSAELARITTDIRAYILENLMFSDDGSVLANDASLLEKGVIDSTGVLELAMFLETQFGISVKADDLLPQNFDSVDSMAGFVHRAINGKVAAAAAI